jgi:hypothetical protein
LRINTRGIRALSDLQIPLATAWAFWPLSDGVIDTAAPAARNIAFGRPTGLPIATLPLKNAAALTTEWTDNVGWFTGLGVAEDVFFTGQSSALGAGVLDRLMPNRGVTLLACELVPDYTGAPSQADFLQLAANAATGGTPGVRVRVDTSNTRLRASVQGGHKVDLQNLNAFNASLPDTEQHHVAVAVDNRAGADEVHMYIDGSLHRTVAMTDPGGIADNRPTVNWLSIGAQHGATSPGSNQWKGQLRRVLMVRWPGLPQNLTDLIEELADMGGFPGWQFERTTELQ